MATPRSLEAYEAWHAAKRALDEAVPWTPDWLRLRMIEQELRSAFEESLDEQDETPRGPSAPVTADDVAKNRPTPERDGWIKRAG
jgi:hypothetical protein